MLKYPFDRFALAHKVLEPLQVVTSAYDWSRPFFMKKGETFSCRNPLQEIFLAGRGFWTIFIIL